MYIIGFFILMGIGMYIQYQLKSKFEKYSKIPFSANLSGAEVTELMLSDHGIRDVRVVCIPGSLTDHYNPSDKTINLSYDVFHGRSAASAAIAAHETGHAVQDAQAYAFLSMRSFMVPAISFSNKWLSMLLMVGMGLFFYAKTPIVLFIAVVLFGITTLFSFVTLPVEFDASKRALDWIRSRGLVRSDEYLMAKDALTWAAMTYVVAALSSLLSFLYYASMLTGSRRD